jgi:YidC/Oxa1 family membrane protein insertase
MILNLLYNNLIFPIEWLMGLLLGRFFDATEDYGISILLLSLVVNSMMLPLYHVAEKIQRKEETVRKKLQPRVVRIKEAFSGEERFMMLKTLYAQNKYHPIFALRSSLGLFLQVPFFIAAYHLLLNYEAINGVSFIFFKDLSRPDGLLFGINLMPLIMTAINMLSGLVYTGKSGGQEKLQLWGLSILFLVLLYNASVALVFYWTLNNLFSLFKNIAYQKLDKGYFKKSEGGARWNGVLLRAERASLRGLWSILKQPFSSMITGVPFNRKQHIGLFVTSFFGAAILWIFNPLFVYFSSPERLGRLADIRFQSFFLNKALITGLAVYLISFLFRKHAIRYASLAIWGVLISFVYSYLVRVDYGLFRGFRFLHENEIFESAKFAVLPELILLPLTLFIVHRIFIKRPLWFVYIATFFSVSLSLNLLEKHKEYQSNLVTFEKASSQIENDGISRIFGFSKKTKNIILLVPDATKGTLFKEYFQRNPNMGALFSGFTIYPNTVAAGPFTIHNAASLIGGVGKTPYMIEKNPIKPLNELVVEAYDDLIRNLVEKNFEASIFDSPFASCSSLNLRGQKCTTIFSEKYTEGLSKKYGFSDKDQMDYRALYTFSIFKLLPISLKAPFYNYLWGYAFSPARVSLKTGKYYEYLFFKNLPDASFVDNSSKSHFYHLWHGSFVMPIRVGPECKVSRTNYGVLGFDAAKNMTECYLKAIGAWTSWMKENDVYDNTSIIIVADHGSGYNETNWYESAVNPVLMVKDFNSTETLKSSDQLMYNADTLSILCAFLGGCEGVPPDIRGSNPSNRTVVYSISEHGTIEQSKTMKKFENLRHYWINKANLFNNTIGQDTKP